MNRLKGLRKKKSLTQQELADKIGVSKRTLGYWENGEVQIKSDKAKELADYFDVSVGYLLGYTEDKKRYDDEKIFENPQKKVFAFSAKSVHGIEKEKIDKEIIEALKNNAVIISDKNIEIILDFIDNNRLDNPNTYQGKDFTDKMFEYKDLNNLIFELKNNGFSTIFEDIEKED